MKSKNSRINGLREEKGMAIILVVFIATILLVAFYALSMRHFQSHKSSVKIVKSDKALYLADAGIQDAMGQLRNPAFDYITPGAHIEGTAQNGAEGSYYVTFALGTGAPVGRQYIIAMSSGTLPGGTTRMIKATIETQDLGKYAFFITGGQEQNFNGGTTLTGEVYARRAHLSIASTPLKAKSFTWVDEPSDVNDDLLTGYAGNESNLQDVLGNALTPERLTQAKTTLTLTNIVNYSDTLFASDQTLGYGYISAANKSYFANAADIYPPTNSEGIYYYEGTDDLEIKGVIHGRITFVAKNSNIRIMGDITRGDLKDQIGNPLDSAKHPVSKVGLFSNESVIIDANASSSDVNIDAQIFAPNGGFKAEGSPTANKVNFTGSISLKDPVELGSVFGGGNVYTYNETVYADNPFPYLTKIADIISWQEVTKFN